MDPKISHLVIVPVHNEAPVLERSIHELSSFLTSAWQDKDASWIILIADNGSQDGTGDIVKKIAADDWRVRYLHIPTAGRGAAFREAVASYSASYYLFVDVDLPVALEDLKRLSAPLENKTADLVFGKRIGFRTWYRKIMTRGWSFFMKTLFDVALSDAQCGVFAANARAVDVMASCTENGWFLNSELIVRGKESGLRIAEIPVSWIETRFPERKSKVANPPIEMINGLRFFGRMTFRPGTAISHRMKVLIAAGVLLAILLAANVIAAYGQGYGMLSGLLPAGVLATVFALTLYFFVLFKASGYANGPRWRTAMTIILVFFALYFLITLPMLPDRSQDVYWNLLLARGFSLFHLNPYTTTPAMLPSSIWSAPVSAWTTLVMTHGPLWVLSLFLPSLLGQPFTAIVALKIIFFAVLCCALVAFWKILARMNIPPENRPQYFMLLLWNPFLFQQIFIDLHADVFVLASIVLAFYFFLNDEGWASILALVIGGFFKYVPWLLLPIPIFLGPTAQLLPPRVVVRRALGAGALLLAGFAIYYLPFGGPVVGLGGFFHQTLDIFNPMYALVGTDLLHGLSDNELILRIIGVLIFYISLVILARKKKLPESFSIPFLFLFFFGTSWFVPWYFLWVLPLLLLVFSPGIFVILCAILMLMPDIIQPLPASVLAIVVFLFLYIIRRKSGPSLAKN